MLTIIFNIWLFGALKMQPLRVPFLKIFRGPRPPQPPASVVSIAPSPFYKSLVTPLVVFCHNLPQFGGWGSTLWCAPSKTTTLLTSPLIAITASPHKLKEIRLVCPSVRMSFVIVSWLSDYPSSEHLLWKSYELQTSRYFNVVVKDEDLFSRCVVCNCNKYLNLHGNVLLQILVSD